MNNLEQFNKLKSEITDEKLIADCKLAVINMCKTGGRSFTMCVPVTLSDTDIILSELISRYEKFIAASEPACTGNCGMNYCDENGCIDRKRNFVDTPTVPYTEGAATEQADWTPRKPE